MAAAASFAIPCAATEGDERLASQGLPQLSLRTDGAAETFAVEPAAPAVGDTLALTEVNTEHETTLPPVADTPRQGFIPRYWGEFRPQLPSIAVSLAASSLMRLGIVNVMKHNITSWRPDGSDDNSMPSRHAVWAYGVATTATNFLVPMSPWWGLGAHAAAAAIGFERVLDHKHYPGDVLAGAGIGVGTSLISDQVSRLVFSRPSHYSFPNEITDLSSLSLSTGASFPMAKRFGALSLGSALVSQVQYTAPATDDISIAAALALQTAPLKRDRMYIGNLSRLKVGAGAMYKCPVGSTPLEFTASARAGVFFTFSNKVVSAKLLAPMAEVDCGLSLHLTDNFTIGATAGYGISSLKLTAPATPGGPDITRSRALSAFNCSFLTIVHF